MRCPSCGNDVNKDDFVCIYCTARLKTESIESVKIFERVTDEKWTNPMTGWKRLSMVLTNPSRAFWDITHYREKVKSFKVIWLIAAAFGFLGMAMYSHIYIPMYALSTLVHYLAVFLEFFLFGLIFYSVFIFITTKIYAKGANYSIGLSDQLKMRYGEGKKKKKEEEEDIRDIKKTRAMQQAEGGYLEELPDDLTGTKSKKGAIMRFAFAPLFIAILIAALIIWIVLPRNLPFSSTPTSEIETFFKSAMGILFWVETIILIGWIPITMSIALRDIANASTLRVYISSVIVSVLICWVVFFINPVFLFQ